MTYNFDKDICDRCGITKEEAKKYSVNTGINYSLYCYITSFYLDCNGRVLCARCYKEMELKSLFKVIDYEDEKEIYSRNRK